MQRKLTIDPLRMTKLGASKDYLFSQAQTAAEMVNAAIRERPPILAEINRLKDLLTNPRGHGDDLKAALKHEKNRLDELGRRIEYLRERGRAASEQAQAAAGVHANCERFMHKLKHPGLPYSEPGIRIYE